ncbi:DNA alkylation repair protein [Cytophagaceae bacterium DM2B3-1]|uniref:DNA alkylation repair protein n=1 Tax=Xanthocytophaga flava TaxID=3048013 RepID=A0ABT7CW18_9BACT|nr:DNA alkylation repair protein [Xanthocytophaga flavus]MDJ1497135.1 DNA alkylation repair protein [Xanthocytophaga flavus]
MSLIKDIYTPAFYNRFADVVTPVIPSFEKDTFVTMILTDSFTNMEWKERMLHTTKVFHHFLPAAFPEAAPLLLKTVDALLEQGWGEDGLAFVFLPEYVALYGLDDLAVAIPVLERLTQFVSCEFAVRPFLLKYGNDMIREMTKWSLHPNHKVRRLASEGSRPRLPWGLAIPALKKDPLPILPLLENLKNDPSEWVRRSVANNLNDIAKDNPAVVLEIAHKWKGHSKETDAIIKHGCRTLLKQGHTEVLSYYGLQSSFIAVKGFEIRTTEVKMGDTLEFAMVVTNTHTQSQIVRLEYGIYYLKANGSLNRKVFKISEREYKAGESATVVKRHSFRPITTRVFYAGVHQASVIINGVEMAISSFTLI